MTDSSVNAKFELLKKYGLTFTNYQMVCLQFPAFKRVPVEDMEYAIVNLLDHVSQRKIIGKQDLPFLTLDREEVDCFINFFNQNDKDLKLETFRSFIGDPKKLFGRIEHCIKYAIPYKDQDNSLLSILSYEDEPCRQYLKGYFMESSPDKDLSEDEMILFNKVSGILQKIVYENTKGPLIIFDPLEKDIIAAVKSNPNLSEEKIAYEIIKTNSSLRIITEGIAIPFATSGSDGSRRQTGQR
jgi:hypothetical protein